MSSNLVLGSDLNSEIARDAGVELASTDTKQHTTSGISMSELSIIQRSCVRQAHDLLDNYLNFGSGFSVVQLFLIQ